VANPSNNLSCFLAESPAHKILTGKHCEAQNSFWHSIFLATKKPQEMRSMSTFFIADKASGMPSMVTSYLPCRDTDKASPGMLPWQHPTFLAVINDKASPRMPSVLLHFAVADSPVDKSFKGPDDFQGDQPRRPSEGERQSFPLVLLAGCPALLDKISFAFVPWTNKFCVCPLDK
jgi:hypothetical protein